MTPRSFPAIGIILRIAALAESDRFVTVFTQEYGKLTCIAKGVRSIKSRRNPHLELMNRVRLQLWKSRHYFYLTQAVSEARFSELKHDIRIVSSGTFIVEATERLTPSEMPHSALYDMLNDVLELIQFYPEHHAMLRETYLIKLLQILGNITGFRTCSHCQKRLPSQDAFLDRDHSTLSCETCSTQRTALWERIPLETLKLMNFILEHPLRAILQVRIEARHYDTIQSVGRLFLRQNLSHPLKSETALAIY